MSIPRTHDDPSQFNRMNEASENDLIIRAPATHELARVTYLFRDIRLRSQARILVAVRSRPVERFVAAATWWTEGGIGCFQLASLPGSIRNEACALLVNQLLESARISGLKSLQYGELLPDNSELIEFLKGQGFDRLRSERFFEVSDQQSWMRTMDSFEKYKAKIPPGWHTESIRRQAPETIFDLIDPYRLMPPSELRDYWREDSPLGFELDLSSILFDGTRPIGTLLARHIRDALCVDVRVVRVENKLLSALGNILLFYHVAVRKKPGGTIRRLQFRGGATEHRETANLALRMGGLEMPPRHVYFKAL
jgi:hypothetical protein